MTGRVLTDCDRSGRNVVSDAVVVVRLRRREKLSHHSYRGGIIIIEVDELVAEEPCGKCVPLDRSPLNGKAHSLCRTGMDGVS